MVLQEFRILEPAPILSPETQDTTAAAIQEFWKRVDIDTHQVQVAYLSLFALTHNHAPSLTPKETELMIFGDLHHDDGKRSPKISSLDYFKPNMSRAEVMELFGDHAIISNEMLVAAFPHVSAEVVTSNHWHHSYSEQHKQHATYLDRLLDLTNPANNVTRKMTSLRIVSDRINAAVELRHQKTESKTDEQIMANIEAEFDGYPPEFGLTFEDIDVASLIAEARRVQGQPFSWSIIAHEMEVFGSQTGKSLEPLIQEFYRMDELVSWTLASYLTAFAEIPL